MGGLTRKGKDDEKKNTKGNDVTKDRAKFTNHPTYVVLNVATIQMVVLVDMLGNDYKSNPCKIIVENVMNNVSEISPEIEKSKGKDVDVRSLTQTLDSIHVSDDPHREDNIEIFF